MTGLPARGPAARELGLPLPPGRMPRRQGARPLKRWRYLGAYGPDLMICAGRAFMAGLPLQSWWAIARPGAPIEGGTHAGRVRPVALDEARLEVGPIRLGIRPHGSSMEVVSPSGSSWIWTRKQPVDVVGSVAGVPFEAAGLTDESAGYHARVTAWKWSAGVGETVDGRRVAWNLVTGVHDSNSDSERTVWVDGEPSEVGPASFADDLSGVETADGGALAFEEWSAREDDTDLVVFRSSYRQPFGTFSGELPGGLVLAAGYGVMEAHDVRW